MLSVIAQELHIPTIERHIFLCADQTKPKCCDRNLSISVWEYLKQRIKDLNLETKVFRTKANCLRICQAGPIMVVYPDGVWYHSVDAQVIDRILEEHILGNQIVQDYVIYAPDSCMIGSL
jgi:(2Fe-2S) ferredoxin